MRIPPPVGRAATGEDDDVLDLELTPNGVALRALAMQDAVFKKLRAAASGEGHVGHPL